MRSGRELIDAWLYAQAELAPADIVRTCQGYLSRSYVYDILSGTKTAPSWNTVIMIALALQMDVKSADRLMKAFGYRDLYPRDGSDLTVI